MIHKAAGSLARLVRQQWRDDRPLEVGDFVTALAHGGTSGHIESRGVAPDLEIYET
jgi:hypothetical protein